MVSNEDIKKNLELRRKGIDPDDPKQKVLNGIYSQMKANETRSKSEKNPLDRICPKCGVKNYLTSVKCMECGENLPSLTDLYHKPSSNNLKKENELKKLKTINDSLEEKNFEKNYKNALEKNTLKFNPKNFESDFSNRKIINYTFQKSFAEVFNACLNAIQKSKLNIKYSNNQKGQITASYGKDEIYIKLRDYNAKTRLSITSNTESNSNQKIKELYNNISLLIPETKRNPPRGHIKTQIKGSDDHNNWIILTTEIEGISVQGKGFFTGWDKGNTFIKYTDITNISLIKGLLVAKVEISVPGKQITIRNVNQVQGQIFTSIVQDLIQKLKSKPQDTPQTAPLEQKFSPMDEIKKAKELLDIGAINQNEFDEIKNKYMKKI